MRSERCKAGEKVRQVVIIAVSDDEYAIPIEHVREITRIEKVQHVPDAADYVAGLINLRGQAIPLVSLHVRFGLQNNTEKIMIKNAYALITEYYGVQVALLVDEVREVRSVPHLEEVPPLINTPYVKGVINLSGRLIMEIDIKEMLRDSGIEELTDNAREEK